MVPGSAANLAATASILLLFRLVRNRIDEFTALTTVALLSFFLASVFLSAGYTGASGAVLEVSFFLLIDQERFWMAAAVAGLAAGTRSSGILLSMVLAFELGAAGRGEPSCCADLRSAF